MIAKLRRRSAAWWCRGRRRRTRPRQCLPGRAATLSPQSSLPGQWRRRRNSLVVVAEHQNTSTKKDNVCLASTGDNAYPNPASPFSNMMVSWMTLRCSRHVKAQRLLLLRLHVTRLMIGSDMSGKYIEQMYLTVERKLRQYQNKCKNLPCQQRKPLLTWTVTRCKDKRPGVSTETTNNERKNVLVNITKRAVLPHRRRLAL